MKSRKPLAAAELLLSAAAVWALSAFPARAAVNHVSCSSLTTVRTFKDTTITTAMAIGADATTKAPAFCEVTGVITAAPGSRITVVYRLPESWNGKLLGLGGSGWSGNISTNTSGARNYTAVAGLSQGYATAQTDGGHATGNVWDTSFAANPASATDFSYRAVHLMTSIGKAVVAKYYGHPQTRAYFQGCSTGGRQGLMEVQKFPDDYNGVIAGAPVYSLLTQTSALLRNETFAAPGAALSGAQMQRLHKAALAACDALDGVKDGLVSDPRACTFDPVELQCKDGAPTQDCFSTAQVAAVRSVYAGVQTGDGHIASYPLSRGGEGGWSRFVTIAPTAGAQVGTGDAGNGLGGLRNALFGNPDYDLTAFNAEKDLPLVRGGEFAAMYEAKNPDIAPFLAHGGKLLLWHGFDDPGPSPLATIEYYENVQRTVGAGTPALDSGVRLFLLSGVYHCRGGAGADGFDSLTALDRWVEAGQLPDTIVASREDGKLSRPLCRYPTLPHYRGTGDPAEAGSFECR
jgi:feruloyl esterase